MKTFLTVRDIEDMHAAGVVDIETHDNMVLTDVAREKAIALGMRLVAVKAASGQGSDPLPPRPAATAAPPAAARRQGFPAGPGNPDAETIRKIKAAVSARLGTNKYDDLLDTIIPQVMAQMRKP